MNTLAKGALVPVPGGVLIQKDGVLLGKAEIVDVTVVDRALSTVTEALTEHAETGATVGLVKFGSVQAAPAS